MISVLFIDDEEHWRSSFRRTLIQNSVTSADKIFTAASSAEAADILSKEEIDLVFIDLIMKGESGEDVLQWIKSSYPEATAAVITAVNDVQSVVRCLRLGAADFMTKTMPVEEFLACIRRVVRMCILVKENKALKSGLLSNESYSEVFDSFITVNPKIKSIFKYLTAVASSNQPVLITGESGVGKGVLAKALAKLSRPGKPFYSLNVAGLDSHMFSDTLFGHVKGAFTGADTRREGIIQMAKDGTVFLDEIGELPIQSQLKLLYVTQEGEFQPLGSDNVQKTGARFICATNQNLEERQKTGEFRKDLFYRLNTHRVHLPPLREHPEDIEVLLKYFLKSASMETGIEEPHIDSSVIPYLRSYSFPGNVRQLRSAVYDVITKSSGMIMAEDFREIFSRVNYSDSVSFSSDFLENTETLPKVDDVVKQMIDKAMKLTDGNQTKAAALIGLSQSTLSRRLKNDI